jgi:hypothetical protein
MAFVLVGFVLDRKALRRESLGQLLCDDIGGSHAAPLAHVRKSLAADLIRGWKPVFGHDHVPGKWAAGWSMAF